MAWLWSRQLDSALEATTRCLELKPSAAAPRLLRSHILMFSGRGEAAIEVLDDYMAIDPLYPDIALHFVAEARFLLRQFELAREAIGRRLARNPESPTAHALLASICGHLGRVDEGRAAWAQVARLDPSFSVERRRLVLPFRNPEDFELRVDGLRKLGVDF